MTTQPTITEETVEVWNGRITMRVKVAGAGIPTPLPAPRRRAGVGPVPEPPGRALHRLRARVPRHQRGDPYAIHQVDDLASVLLYEELVRKLGLVKPVVVGQSFGGMMAASSPRTSPSCPRRSCVLDPIGLWLDEHPVANWIATPAEACPRRCSTTRTSPAAQAMLALPEDPERQRAAIAGLVWAFGCTGKFTWPIPDRGLRGGCTGSAPAR